MRWTKFNKKGKQKFFFFLCESFWRKINKNKPSTRTAGSTAWSCSAHAEQLQYKISKDDVCCRTIVSHTATLDLVLMSLQIIRCSFTLCTSFTAAAALLTDWRAATAWCSHGSTQESHVETKLVRNWPNSNADCSVYTALQPGAGGSPRCMCRHGRVCGGGVFGREQAITTSISHPDSLRDGKWLLVGFGRWLWMKKAQSYNGFLTNLIHQLIDWSYHPYHPHPSSINIKRWFITLKHFIRM